MGFILKIIKGFAYYETFDEQAYDCYIAGWLGNITSKDDYFTDVLEALTIAIQRAGAKVEADIIAEFIDKNGYFDTSAPSYNDACERNRILLCKVCAEFEMDEYNEYCHIKRKYLNQ